MVKRNQSKVFQLADLPLSILSWVILAGISVWLLSHIGRTVLLFILAVFFAYSLAPVVTFLEKKIPRIAAILIVYLLLFIFIGVLSFFVVNIAIEQFTSLIQNISHGNLQSQFMNSARTWGISQSQINSFLQQFTTQAEALTGSIVPFLSSIFNIILDTLIVAVMSIYLLTDRERLLREFNTNVPIKYKKKTQFILKTLDRVAGGYIRGQIILCILVGLFVGIGMQIMGVPYAVLLGVLAFILEFIPIVGTILSGVICTILALTKGWVIALVVLVYFIVVHVVEGDILGPRIVGKAIGLHPVVSILALIIGTELFGITGALFAAPVAGVLQIVLLSFWEDWQALHLNQFSVKK